MTVAVVAGSNVTVTSAVSVAVLLALGTIVYAFTALVLLKVLRNRYRSLPATHVTAAGSGIFVVGIGLLYLSGEHIWELPFNFAVTAGAVGAAIVNVGATMMVGPWLAGLVASDLRRVASARGPRGTEAQLAQSLVRIANSYGASVAYEAEPVWDFVVTLGQRELRVELGALTPHPTDGDVVTDPRAWFKRISASVSASPPTDRRPVLVVVNSAMLTWLTENGMGFASFDDSPSFGFQLWNGRARDDAVLQGSVEALLFGITNAARRNAVRPVVAGLGGGVGGDDRPTPTRRVAD